MIHSFKVMNYSQPVSYWKAGQLVAIDSIYLRQWEPPENLNTFMVIERSQEQPEFCITVYSFTTQLCHCIHHTYLREIKNEEEI